jgi:hypothetical protein
MDDKVIAPGAQGEFVELARTKQGRLFKKHILNYGELKYPGVTGGKVQIDDKFADTLIENFDKGVCDIVQVPKAGPNNEHTEDPDRNIGEVIGIEKDAASGKIYATIDARDEDAANKLGKTLLGASAMMALDYTDTNTQEKVGPTLLHVAVTNRPYITNLDEYGEIIAASADGSSDAVLLAAPTQEVPMDKNELIAALLEHGVDVAALTAKADQADKAVALTRDIESKLGEAGVLTLSNGETATGDSIVGAVADLGTKVVELSNTLDTVVKASAAERAASTVDALITEGKIIPAERDARISLYLSNKEIFDNLVPAEPIVNLSNAGRGEKGSDYIAGSTSADDQKMVQDEIARLTASPAAAPYLRASA